MLIAPCSALPPNLALDGPFRVSTLDARFKEVSKRLLTLQNPAGLIGRPSSRIKKDPQAPEPVRTGDLKEIKLSCPEPLLIQLPAERLKSSFA